MSTNRLPGFTAPTSLVAAGRYRVILGQALSHDSLTPALGCCEDCEPVCACDQCWDSPDVLNLTCLDKCSRACGRCTHGCMVCT